MESEPSDADSADQPVEFTCRFSRWHVVAAILAGAVGGAIGLGWYVVAAEVGASTPLVRWLPGLALAATYVGG
ncbi:MAG: hypothetical protein ABEL76_01755, partial [Bradymonadaceae bacterium]